MNEVKYSVKAENISKCYKMYTSPKQKLLDLISSKGAGKEFYALKDVSFEVQKGDVVGLIGLNGSGKSTLSNILGGVSMPTTGKIDIVGESSLIAIGLGLNSFLTGMENIELKSIMMGYSKEEIEKITQEIIDFADIGDFITQPIRTYSSGMKSRLGFAISVYTNPDILVIDEALSVGDPTFTQKCLDKMNDFKKRGKTIFFVSHSTSQIRQFCNKVIWLEYGSIRGYGTTDEILPKYDEYIRFINSMSEHEKRAYKNIVLQHQEHALLNEFKVVDSKYRKVEPKGKFFKHVALINKSEKVKYIPYNIDLATIAFGFVPALIRRRFLVALVILLVQLANFFILPYPYSIFSNFIITTVISLFTGREYVGYLIGNCGYLDYNIWKINYKEIDQYGGSEEGKKYRETKVKKKESEIKKKNKISKLIAVISVLAILVLPFAVKYIEGSGLSLPVVVQPEQEAFKSIVSIVLLEDDGGEKKVNSIGVLQEDKETKEMKVITYSGDMFIDSDHGYKQIKEIITPNEEIELRKLLKNKLNIQYTEYLFLDLKDYGVDLQNISGTNDLYNKILNDFFVTDMRRKNENINKIIKSNTSLNSVKITKFYDRFINKKNFVVKSAACDKVAIKDVIDIKILQALGKENLQDVEVLLTDKNRIEETSIIKNIRAEYQQYISSLSKSEDSDENSISYNTESGENQNSFGGGRSNTSEPQNPPEVVEPQVEPQVESPIEETKTPEETQIPLESNEMETSDVINVPDE